MILLVRDPRDVVLSSLDATREGSWQEEQRRAAPPPGNPGASGVVLRVVGVARDDLHHVEVRVEGAGDPV